MDASCSISNYKLHCLFLLLYPALLLPIPGETFHICWTGIGVDLFSDVLKCLLLSPGWGPVWQAVYGRPHTPGYDCNGLPQHGKLGYKGSLILWVPETHKGNSLGWELCQEEDFHLFYSLQYSHCMRQKLVHSRNLVRGDLWASLSNSSVSFPISMCTSSVFSSWDCIWGL